MVHHQGPTYTANIAVTRKRGVSVKISSVQSVSCILQHEMKRARRWLSRFVAARIVSNYGECFLNGIIALQQQPSALAGY